MKEEISPALWQELKKLGRELTPDELRQRGVKRLITIRTSAVSLGIERAINRTILERTIGRADPEELRTFTTAASAEFASRLRDGDERRAAPGHARAENGHDYAEHLPGFGELLEQHRLDLHAELETVHAELNERRGFAEQQESPALWPMDAERADDLRLRVQARLLPIFERLPAGNPPLRSVVADLLALFGEERAVALAELRRENDADLAQLERRLAKLIVSVEHTESLLAHIGQESKSRGLASAYREVQGLDSGEGPDSSARDLERRREMLDEIFRANVELQHGLEGPTQVVKEGGPFAG